MPVLVAAVVVVGLLCLANLLFLFGVIRRLREHTSLLAEHGIGAVLVAGTGSVRKLPPGHEVAALPGSVVPAYSTTTVDGEHIAGGGPEAPTLVGVFSPGCSACTEQLPAFLEFAGRHRGGRDRVLAVVSGDTSDAGDQPAYVDQLRPVARLVVGEPATAVTEALQVRGYPAFALIEDGVVRASGFQVAELELTAATTS